MKKIPITILNGYLGAGKTTILNNLLNNQEGLKVAVIVNDLGEVNVDAKLIEKGTEVSQIEDDLIELSNGCICCTLKNDLIIGIEKIVKSNKFDYIIIESSGVTEPIPVVQTILFGQTSDGKLLQNLVYIDSMMTVVDAFRLKKEFKLGEALKKEEHEHHHHDHDHEEEHNHNHDDHEHEHEEEPIAGLLVEQIEFCDLVVINKADLVNETELNVIKSYVHKIQPKAKMIVTTQGKLDYNEILNVKSFDINEVQNSAGWIQEITNPHHHGDDHNHSEEYGISSFVYRRRRPFNVKKLGDFFNQLDKTIIRVKGIVWLHGDDENIYMLSQAGGDIKFDVYGKWLVTYDQAYIDEVLKTNKFVKDNYDEVLGDKTNELVIIGYHMDQDEVESLLDLALETI